MAFSHGRSLASWAFSRRAFGLAASSHGGQPRGRPADRRVASQRVCTAVACPALKSVWRCLCVHCACACCTSLRRLKDFAFAASMCVALVCIYCAALVRLRVCALVCAALVACAHLCALRICALRMRALQVTRIASLCWWRVTFECALLPSVHCACVCTTRVSAAFVRVAWGFASCRTRCVVCTVSYIVRGACVCLALRLKQCQREC